MSEKYNGWTNYATWRVNLEIFDGFDPAEYFDEVNTDNVYHIAQVLQDHAEQVIFECGECNPQTLAGSYALAFLSDVNWHEIAEHLISDYAEQD